MLTPGSTLGGRYQLTERIASGGMGDVWKAEDTVLGRTVAVKVLLPALLEEHGFVDRFRAEARTMATISHPGVVNVYDFGESELPGGGRSTYLVMEYVRGEALNQVLANHGRLTPARALALIAQAADALQAAHDKGIIHRDVKPGNLLVRPDGTLVLTDFGIARSGAASNLTAAGATLGTAAYMSPEQATGQPVGPISDVYSLGVVAYQCVSGHRPFEGDNPLAVAMMHIRDTPPPMPGDVPPPVRQFIERAMAKEPEARWPSASAMARAARTIAAGGAAPVSPAPTRTAVMPPVVPPVIPSGQPGAPRTENSPRGAAAVPVPGPPHREYRAPEPPKKNRALAAAVVAGIVVLLLSLIGVVYALTAANKGNDKDKPGTTTTPTSTPRTTPTTPSNSTAVKAIDCQGMRGRSWGNVQGQLRKDGFSPQREDVESPVKEGDVVEVPCEAAAGSTVTVKVSKGKAGGGGFPTFPTFPSSGASRSPGASPAPSRSSSPSPVARPGVHTGGTR